MKYVVIKNYNTALDASIGKAKLDSENIFCLVDANLHPYETMTNGGVELKVREKDIVLAAEVLDIDLNSLYGKICPKCRYKLLPLRETRNDTFDKMPHENISNFIALFVSRIKLWNAKNSYVCRNCSVKYKNSVD